MSALDFGAGIGQNPDGSTRYYTGAMPQLPNGDWCIGVWVQLITYNAATNPYGTVLCHPNDETVAEGYRIFTQGTTVLTLRVRGSGGTTHSNNFTVAYDNRIVLCIMQRRGANFEGYVETKGNTPSAPGWSTATDGTTIASTSDFRIGRSNFGGDGWANPSGELFVFNDRSLISTDVTNLLAGAPPTVIAQPLVYLKFRDLNRDGAEGQSTEPNVGSGGTTYNAAKTRTDYTTTTDFWQDAIVNCNSL